MTLYWGASYDLPSHFQSLSHWPAISLASEKASHHNLSPAHFTHESIPSSIYECLWAFPGSLWSRSQKYSQQFSCHTNTFVWPIIKPPLQWNQLKNDDEIPAMIRVANLFFHRKTYFWSWWCRAMMIYICLNKSFILELEMRSTFYMSKSCGERIVISLWYHKDALFWRKTPI